MQRAKRPRFGQLVIGPPGAGKSTYCFGLQQFFAALGRPCSVVNLDPAVASTPYAAAASVVDLVSLDDAMREHGLGPNGAMLYCMEALEHNVDWLDDALDALPAEDYVVFDMPGQVELSTDHDSLRRVVEHLTKRDVRLAAVHLTDAHHVSDAAKYVSVVLLALRTMLQLELPHVNVLSKVDLVAQHGQLPFNLDFYTDVQDLSHLKALLDAASRPRFKALNRAICDVVEDFGLVSFRTLCVEDKQSMAALVKAVDIAIGFVDAPAAVDDGMHDNDDDEGHAHAHAHSTLRKLAGALPYEHPSDVQERYVDHVDAFREHDREGWRREGELAAAQRSPGQS